jgi:hypothetical protein
MLDPDDGPAFSVVTCLASSDEEALRGILDRRGFSTFTLHGAGVHDKSGFLKQAAADLPTSEGMDPHNWDAFADVLWNVVYEADAEQVGLLWTGADSLAHSDLQDFLDAVRGIIDVARSVMSGEGSFPRETTMLTFLLGSGPEFRRLEDGRLPPR